MKKKSNKRTKKSITQSKRRKSKRNYKKKSILDFKRTDIFTKEDIEHNINKKFLGNKYNFEQKDKEVFLQNGIIHKSSSGIIYTRHNALITNTIDLSRPAYLLLSNSISNIVSNIKNEKLDNLINKKLKRFVNYKDEDNELYNPDSNFQLKILKIIINENMIPNFKYLNKKKNIALINELIEFRNLLSHNVYKTYDLKKEKKTKSIKTKINKKTRSMFYQKNKLRQFNYLIKIIKKMQTLLNNIYTNRQYIKLDDDLFKKNYRSLSRIIPRIQQLCLVRERSKRLDSTIKSEKQLNDIAKETLVFLNKKLNSKSKKIRNETSRGILNIILPRITYDTVLKKINPSLSNKACTTHCKKI
jgi:hypothetical protein